MFISAEDFWNMWKESIIPKLDNHFPDYNDDRKWTELFKREIYNDIKERLNIPRLRLDDHLIDCVYACNENLIYCEKERFWPVKNIILLEHENQVDTIQEEIYKLIHRKAPLKVVISYNNSSKPNYISNKIYECSRFIRDSNKWFAENSKTEYLFIIGDRNAENNGLKWSVYIISTGGQRASFEYYVHTK